MVDCRVGVWIVVVGGGGRILPCAGVRVCDFVGCWVCVFGDGFALFISAFGKYWASCRWNRIKNCLALEEIKLFGLYFFPFLWYNAI